MAKASDNQFPKVTFAESAAPATPATGLAAVYVKSDGKLYLKDDAGTETDLTATGSTPAHVGVKAYRSATYSLTRLAVTAFPWDAEEWDTDAFHDNSTNPSRFTVPSGKDGKYRIHACIGTDVSNTADRFNIYLTKNGTLIRGGGAEMGMNPTGYWALNVSCEVSLVATDYVEATYYHDSAADRNAYLGMCAFSMTKIG